MEGRHELMQIRVLVVRGASPLGRVIESVACRGQDLGGIEVTLPDGNLEGAAAGRDGDGVAGCTEGVVAVVEPELTSTPD